MRAYIQGTLEARVRDLEKKGDHARAVQRQGLVALVRWQHERVIEVGRCSLLLTPSGRTEGRHVL